MPEVFKSSNNGFRTEWIHNALQAQYGQPLTLEELFEPILKSDNKTKRFFIEAGAHDGIGGSNTLRFELNPLWSGLLVEPNPKVTICKGYKKNKTITPLVAVKYNSGLLEGMKEWWGSILSNGRKVVWRTCPHAPPMLIPLTN